MNIIDHMYIGIILPLFHTVVIEKLTKTYPILTYPIPYSLLKYSSCQSIPYHNILSRQSSKRTSPQLIQNYQLYTQAWTKFTIILLHRPTYIQIIIDALIYHLPLDKPINTPPHQSTSRIFLTDDKFTTDKLSFSNAAIQYQLTRNHQFSHDYCILHERHYHSYGSIISRNFYYIPYQFFKYVNTNIIINHIERKFTQNHDM